MDSFVEYMVKQKKKGIAIVKSILIFIAALIVSLLIAAIILVFFPVALSALPLAVAALFYGAYRVVASYDVEFEYILTNGELDVDKITHRKKRKRMITIHSKSFIAFGKMGDAGDERLDKKEFARIIDASANSSVHQDYYAMFFKNGQKIKLIFNPTQKMIDIFRAYCPRVIGE